MSAPTTPRRHLPLRSVSTAYFAFLFLSVAYLLIVSRTANLRLADAIFHLASMTLAFLAGFYALSGWTGRLLGLRGALVESMLNILFAFAVLLVMSWHQKRWLSHPMGLEALALLSLGHALAMDLRHFLYRDRSPFPPTVSYFGLLVCSTLFGFLATAMYIYIKNPVE